MYTLSYAWHGLFLQDLVDLKVPLTLYLVLAAVVYLLIGLLLTLAAHKAIELEFISLKGAFPMKTTMLGGVFGFFVFLLLFILGMSFTKNEVTHILADALWQMFEQGIGGLGVSLGIIYDLHQTFLEQERAD